MVGTCHASVNVVGTRHAWVVGTCHASVLGICHASVVGTNKNTFFMVRNGAFLEWQCKYLLQVVRYSLNQTPEIKIGLGLGLDGYFPILYFKNLKDIF